MGNLCGTAKADQGGGVLDLNQKDRRPGDSRHSEAQQGASGRSDQQEQSTSAAAASKGQDGANASAAAAAAAAAAAGVGVKVACTGSKVEALAVEYLKNEVPGDRAVYGQDRLESRGDDVLVEEIAEPEEREMHWQQGELIGAGAFGRVYLGLDLDSGQLMAVKQVSIARDEALKGQVAAHVHSLEAEVNVLKQLHHPNIVRYLGTERVTSDMSSLNIFLEYVPGGSIASLLSKFGSFTESVLRVYTKQILLGLEFLHTHQIMHRDIKGANILVDNTGVVKLADFGASKKIEDLVTMDSGFKSIKGTPYWMAPEVIKQTGHGRQADIWSVGCTVIEMATGKPPWSEFAQPVSALFKIASSKDPPPIPQHLSPEAQDFLLLCFNRVPKDRPNATRLLQHPFLSNPLPTKSAAPSRIPPSNPAPQQQQKQQQPPQQPRQQQQQQPPPPQFQPPPAIGTGFRFVPTKPMSPITEVTTLTTPEANGSRGTGGGRPPAGPPSVSPTPSSVNTVTPSPKPAVDFFGNLNMDTGGTHQSSGHDPLGSSVAFSVADSVVSDSMSYNPIEEPSWLAQSPEYDPSDFMMADGLPPPQPLGLYNSPGKENRAGRSGRTPPSAGTHFGPTAVAEQVDVGDERRIMSYVQEKAARDWARLSTPLFENGFGGAEAQATAAAAAAASGGKNETASPSGIVLRPDRGAPRSSARGVDSLTHLNPTGDFGQPSPKPQQQQRKVGRPVRPPSISSQSLQQAAAAAASGGVSSSKPNLHGSSSSRPDKSRQWEEELEKELAAERARKKTPRSQHAAPFQSVR